MAILGLQGVRGVGTTSITAARLGAAILGETVLAIDASPDNMLRFFSTSISSSRRLGARAARRRRLARRRLRYTSHIDLLPLVSSRRARER
jgi:CO dehydrogenase nickel-insertion accessory protein CooC1